MLTMDRYTHLGIIDLTAALDRLPAIPTAGTSDPTVTLSATNGRRNGVARGRRARSA